MKNKKVRSQNISVNKIHKAFLNGKTWNRVLTMEEMEEDFKGNTPPGSVRTKDYFKVDTKE